MKVIALTLLLALAPPAAAAIRHVDTAESVVFSGDNVAFSANIVENPDRFALLAVTMRGSSPVAEVRLGARPLAFVGAVNSGGAGCRIEWWSLVNPPPGVHQVVVRLTGPVEHGGAALVSYSGVDGERPTGSFASASGRSGPASVTVAGVPEGVVLEATCGASPDSVIHLAGPGQIARWHWSIGRLSSAGSEVDAASSLTVSWSESGAGTMEWAMGALVLRPGTGRPPPVDDRLRRNADLAVTSGCAIGRARPAAPTAASAIMLVILWAARRRPRVLREHPARGRVQPVARCAQAPPACPGPTTPSRISTS